MYANIKTGDRAVCYFESLGCRLDDRRKREISQWLDELASPRKLLAFILENTTYREFDLHKAFDDLGQFNKDFQKNYDK